MTTKPFIPSSWLLMQQIASAEAKFEAAREQAALKREARAEERAVRAWTAEAEARRRARLWGR